MKKKKYVIIKTNRNGEITLETLNKINGYKIKPKNSCNYKGISVDSMIIIKPSFIEKVLKKKIKKKLEFYLNYIINLVEEDDDDSCMKALDEIERFRSTIEAKYRQYLDDKYINLLYKKLALIEYEIKNKLKITKKTVKQSIPKLEIEEVVEERKRKR